MSDDEYAYLQEGFNSKSLKKDKLRDILLTHDVEYSSTMLKPQLLDLFNEHIAPRRAELRARFVDVVASESNIEIATPPNIPRLSRSEQKSAASATEASPRARRARSRSPQRSKLSDQASKLKPPTESKPTLHDVATPVLPPPSSSPKIEVPKSPKSPRRRKLARKVEVSGNESEPDFHKVPTDQIKVKVPRSPRRKRAHEEVDDDQSFFPDNVFQNGKQSGKKRRAEPKSELQRSQTSASFGSQLVKPLGLNILPSSDLEFNLNIPAFNPEMDEHASGMGRMQAAQVDYGVAEQIEKAIRRPLQVDDSPTISCPSEVSGTHLHEDTLKNETGSVYPHVKKTPRNEHTRQIQDAQPTPSRPARKGYLPNYFDLGVSKEFVEQLEPFLAPTPVQTPKAQYFAESRQGGMTPLTNHIVVDRKAPANEGSDRSTPFEIKDPEEAAARDFHEAIGAAARKLDRIPRIRFPRMHLPRFQIRRFPVGVDQLKTFGSYLFTAFALVSNCLLIGVGIALLHWYRDAWSKAEFCGVGARAPYAFPIWTTHNFGSLMVSDLQSRFRDMMVEVWPECVSCPNNARCYQGRGLVCDKGYSPAQHPLAWMGVWKQPPRCLPDWEAQRKTAVLSERATSYLREQRAQVLCDNPEMEDSAVEEATAIQASELKSRLMSEKSSILDGGEFEELWQQVLQELPEKHSDVYVVSFGHSSALKGKPEGLDEDQNDNLAEEQMLTQSQNDTDNSTTPNASTLSEVEKSHSQKTWLASNSDSSLSLKCRFRRHVARWLRVHRSQVVTAVLIAISTFIFGITIIKRRSEHRNRAVLVSKFLAQLKQQRHASDADHTGNTVAYLKASDLRKIVPRSQVKVIQDVLERVDGVRMRQVEIYGEITRIWEWAP